MRDSVVADANVEHRIQQLMQTRELSEERFVRIGAYHKLRLMHTFDGLRILPHY
jgi:hypothetical protein